MSLPLKSEHKKEEETLKEKIIKLIWFLFSALGLCFMFALIVKGIMVIVERIVELL